jgi:hypothetical protein
MRQLDAVVNDDGFSFDFGEPLILPVEIASGKFLSLREPSAEDLMEISKISKDKTLDEIEQTLKTICILHSPSDNGRKLTLKDSKRLTARQIERLGRAVNSLLNPSEDGEEGDDTKSGNDDEES